MNGKIKGSIATITSFILWGILPIYWKQLQTAGPLEMLAHRIIWSCLLLSIILTLRRSWDEVRSIIKWPEMGYYLVTSMLIGGNWLLYLWAVTNARMVEASLGYFINPLVNVLMGIVFLGERLKKAQIVSLVLAGIGVIWLSIDYGRLPLVALGLAFMFGSYGLLRKMGGAKSMPGLFFETSFLSILSLMFLFFHHRTGQGSFVVSGFRETLLLIGAGIVTAVPLVLFNYGTKLIKYSTVGFFQYIAPTLQLLVGVLIYREPFTQKNIFAFSVIWVALIIYTISNFRKKDRTEGPVST